MVELPSWMKDKVQEHCRGNHFFSRILNPEDEENVNRQKHYYFMKSVLEQGYFWGYMDAREKEGDRDI